MKSIALFLLLIGLTASSPIKNPKFYDNNPEHGQLFEGDILGMDVSKGGVTIETMLNRRWKNGIVPFAIDSDSGYTEKEVDIILAGMRHIEDATRVNGKYCIKFVPHTNEPNYVTVYSGSGCSSYIGIQPITLNNNNTQYLSLERPGCVTVGITAHEFLHALGILHEQSRPDRDQYVEIKFENIEQGLAFNFWAFPESLVEYTKDLPYDYQSLMHYSAYSFSKNGQPTIVPKNPNAEIGQRRGLSPIDIIEVQRMYGCI